MKNELLLLTKKHKDTLIEQTRTRPQETLDFKMKIQMENFSFSLAKNLFERNEWLLGVTSFEVTNSVFKITNENNTSSITLPGRWSSRGGLETINELRDLLSLRAQMILNCMYKNLGKEEIKQKRETKNINHLNLILVKIR